MKDYCGDVSGFRVDEKKKTVVLMLREHGVWKEYGGWVHCPVDPMRFPESLSASPSPHGAWDIVWLSLKEGDPQKADALFAFATKGWSGQET